MTDLNKKVHEAMGNCVHNNYERQPIPATEQKLLSARNKLVCLRCGKTVGVDGLFVDDIVVADSGNIPDYAGDPRLYVPLLLEMIKDGSLDTGKGKYVLGVLRDMYVIVDGFTDDSIVWGASNDIGVCVCESWLKWKGAK